MRENIAFPLCELTEKADVESLGDVDPFPIPFVENVSNIWGNMLDLKEG